MARTSSILSFGLRRRAGLVVLLAILALIGALTRHGMTRSPERALIAEVRGLLAREGIAGAVVATGRVGGQPELTAIGMATPDRPMRPDDQFRLASLAKPLTAAAVLGLVRAGRLTLDTPVAEAGPGITVRHLLQHSGGWDRVATFDPIGDPASSARLGLTAADRCEAIADRMPPAQFAPGTRYAYSNLGYCRLGQVIARVSGRSYADQVHRTVLAPRGAALRYGGVPSVRHPSSWTAANFRALGPGGGWSGSAGDYWRFAAGPVDPYVRTRPAYAAPGDASYYGLGWRVWRGGVLSHFGAIEGAFALVVRDGDRVAVVAMNGRPRRDERAAAQLIAAFAPAVR
ncbi:MULTISPECIES: serine hydrolase domain-containing protein [unclassified Sphingomonas]|uniref:serine hydrolase domain-containing protein n=1 Tax=unclassified Sphingomonas TaxID=196159 RepID=UPI000837756E|nr:MULTISPECIES: serine hydrolase domain-containing protein [unclassified Sphingomonas]